MEKGPSELGEGRPNALLPVCLPEDEVSNTKFDGPPLSHITPILLPHQGFSDPISHADFDLQSPQWFETRIPSGTLEKNLKLFITGLLHSFYYAQLLDVGFCSIILSYHNIICCFVDPDG